MKPRKSPPPGDAKDTVADRDGRTFVLRHAQDQLRNSDSAGQAVILNALPAYIALLDNQGLIITVNEAWRRFAGADAIQSPGHGIGVNYLEICDSARGDGSFEARQVAEGIRSVLGGGVKSFSIEYPCHSPTAEHWFLMTVTPLADDRPNGAVVMHLDVTAERQTKQSLRRSEGLKSAILESSLDCVITIDHEGKIVEFNPAAEATFGWTREQALGKAMVELIVPPRLRDAHRRGFAHYLATGHGPILGKRLELEAIRADGTEFPIELAIRAIRATSTPMFTGFIRDITARKRAEDALARVNRVLAVLSSVNSAIVRFRTRQEVFDEACRIAVDHGAFAMAWIGLLDPVSLDVTAVAWAGTDAESLARMKATARSDLPEGRGVMGKAIRAKKPDFNNDINAEDRVGGLRRQEALKRGYRSLIALPLLVDDEVVGNLSLYAREPNFYNEDEIKLLSELAGNISVALEHISRQQKLEKLSRTRAVSSGINSILIRVRDRQELFQESCRIAMEDGQFPFAWIGVLDPATQDVTPVAWAGESAEELTRAKSSARDDSPRGKGAVGRAIRERRPVINNDVAAHSFGGARVKEILSRGFRSQITLPLFEDETVVGTLTMYAREPNFFDEEEVRLLSELAGDISFALANIGRQQKLDKLARIRAVSSEINAAIVRIHDGKALLRETCRIAHKYGKFELVWIAALDREKQEVQPVTWAGFSPDAAHAVSWSSISAARGTLGEAILTRKPAVRNDIGAEVPVGQLRQEALQKGCLSTLCLPLVVDDNVVALIVLFAPGVGFFDEEELALLNEVAANVSFALQAIEKQEKLEYLSYYDVLTGLPNRTLFVDRLSQQMRSRGDEQQMVAVILLDIERFRHINESLGHRGGDDTLNSIAQRLGHAFNGKDYLARISSNGFGAIVRGMKDAAGVVHLVENEVFSCFKQPFMVSDRELWVSVKAGIAMFPVDGESADILFRNAESALQRAKASSDRYLFYAADMNAQAAHAIAMETRLRKAVDARQFVLHYQPKVELRTGRICGLEALIRWNDPATGLVPPMTFIPILEETGMIVEVGMWALQQALSDHARWAAQGLQPPRIAVNVSQIQLRHAGFVEMVANAARAQVNGAAGLALEITESLFMENFEESVHKLKAIRDMGIEISVDDFGTGYSSLSYISRLPIDALKIDRSFVVKMASDPHSMSIVAMVITLAHTLNLKVIAEGVETEEQSNTLKLLRCDEAQGYLFAKPLPGESIEGLLRGRSAAPSNSATSRSAVTRPAS